MSKKTKTTKSLRSSVWLGLVLLITLMWGASTAQASLISLNLTTEFSGGTPPEGTTMPWLNATFDDDDTPGSVTLTLTAPNLTDPENVKSWSFNLNPLLDPRDLMFTLSDSSGAFSAPTVLTGDSIDGKDSYKADGDGFFDILIEFAEEDGSDTRFGRGDEAVYTITGISSLTAASFDVVSAPGGGAGAYETAAHVRSIGLNSDSGWVGTGAIAPEPATLMFLAGSSLMAVSARVMRKYRVRVR